jgi:hypothetical protein
MESGSMSRARGFLRRLGSLRYRIVRALSGVSREEVATLSSDLSEVTAEHDARIALLTESQERVAEQVARLEEEVHQLRRDATEHLRQLTEHLRAVTEGLQPLGERIQALDEGARRAELHARIAPTMAWIAHDDVPQGPLVSVILATRDRSALLRRAIRSVVAQSYPGWELVVVDDGSEDDTPTALASLSDSRVRPVRTEGVGVGAARNRGLQEATGELIAYLDDDNIMHPDWLRSVVWAFNRSPPTEIVYGARVVDDPRSVGLPQEGLTTAIQLEPYDRRRLEAENYIDSGAIAHRADLPEAHFDEDLITQGDWELLLRMTRARPPLVLPAIAALYSTEAPGRLDHHSEKTRERDLIRMRARKSR